MKEYIMVQEKYNPGWNIFGNLLVKANSVEHAIDKLGWAIPIGLSYSVQDNLILIFEYCGTHPVAVLGVYEN